MRFTASVRDSFEAAHRVGSQSGCDRDHGHVWSVEVIIEAGLDPKKGAVVDHQELVNSLRFVLDPLRDRDLNDMLPAVITTPEGLGLYVREQLILEWPRIVGVVVTMGPHVRVEVAGDIR